MFTTLKVPQNQSQNIIQGLGKTPGNKFQRTTKETSIRALLTLYKIFMSPIVHTLGGAGFGCRYPKTCSEYAAEKYIQENFLVATKLVAKRILSCNPWTSRKAA